MGQSIPSNATHGMLKWAREREGFTIEFVAKKEKLDAARLQDWEAGRSSPSLAVLRRLAKRYHRTLSVFYLQEPPRGFNVVKDFRLLARGTDRSFSSELRRALRIAQERQAWVSSYLEDEQVQGSQLVGSSTIEDEPKEAAKKLRGFLGVVEAEHSTCDTESGAYIFWRRACERAGVFVFNATGVEPNEFRGCSLPDAIAPAILLNSREFYRPRIFTILHELAHVMLGETSISGAGGALFKFCPHRPVEAFCNKVATEVLVPERDFGARVPSNWHSIQNQVLTTLSRHYWVSKSVVVLRLYETGHASQRFVDKWFESPQGRAKQSSGGTIPQTTLTIGRVGESFSRVAISAYRDGQIHGGALSNLLGMKLKHLPQLEEKVFPHSVHAVIENKAS